MPAAARAWSRRSEPARPHQPRESLHGETEDRAYDRAPRRAGRCGGEACAGAVARRRVVSARGHEGEQAGAEIPYRVMIEQMQEGAATADAEGRILYGNRRF